MDSVKTPQADAGTAGERAAELVAAAAVVATATVAAAPVPGGILGRIVAWDLAVLRFLGALVLPKAVALPLVFLVRIGDGWMWAAVAAWLWWALPLAQLKAVVLQGLVAIAVSLALYWPLKLLVRRRRPHESGLGVTARVPPLDKYSFPSGHTMNNLAVALSLTVFLPELLWAALGLPILLGALRILFGVHYLSDIAGGALLGIASAYLAQAALTAFPLLP